MNRGEESGSSSAISSSFEYVSLLSARISLLLMSIMSGLYEKLKPPALPIC